MELTDYIRFVLALVFVLALIGLLNWLVRRYGIGGRIAMKRGQSRRLSVVEVAPVDAKRRVVLVRRDQTEHLILLGGGTDVVIEQGIVSDAAPGAAVDETPRLKGERV